MVLADLKTLAQQFISLDLDSFSSTTSGVISSDQCNYAIRILARWLKPLGSLTFNYQAGVSSYSTSSTGVFSAYPIRILSVYINNSPLTNYARQPGLYSFDELQSLYPSWTSPGTGVVEAAAQFGQKLILYKAPSSSGSGYVIATYMPLPLTSDSQSPDLPIELHEAIAYLAASYASKPTMTEQEAIQRVMSYDQAWQSILQEAKKTYEEFQYDSGYDEMQDAGEEDQGGDE